MKIKLRNSVFLFLLAFGCALFASQRVSEGEYIYEIYEPQDTIPLSTLQEAISMYYQAYLHPKLHEGIPLTLMGIDAMKFNSYEEFIADMFHRDFASYELPSEVARFYVQVLRVEDEKVVGVCVALESAPGHYYIDHFGVDKDFRRQGLGHALLAQLVACLPSWQEIALDTRVFNISAQSLYEKFGFRKLTIHPNPAKQSTYIRYVMPAIS